jgi:homoserine kinase type II
VTGLIDFGAMQIDTPAADVARLLGSFVRDDPTGWQSGVAAYTSIRLLSEVELRAVSALDLAGKILAGCNWLRWIYIDGRQFDQLRQIVERFARISERVNRI